MKRETELKLYELRGMLETQRDIFESDFALYGKPASDEVDDYAQGYYNGLARAYGEAAKKAQRSLDELNEIIKEIENA